MKPINMDEVLFEALVNSLYIVSFNLCVEWSAAGLADQCLEEASDTDFTKSRAASRATGTLIK